MIKGTEGGGDGGGGGGGGDGDGSTHNKTTEQSQESKLPTSRTPNPPLSKSLGPQPPPVQRRQSPEVLEGSPEAKGARSRLRQRCEGG